MSSSALVFGGTFDPVHNGHLAVAEQVLQRCAPTAVWFVPAGVPPLRPPARASLQARVAMLHAVAAVRPAMLVVDIESARDGVSYTDATMTQLHREHPDVELHVLLGADAARSIAAWQGHERLLADERFVIVNRSGEQPFAAVEARALGFDLTRTRIVEIDSPHISASEVRHRAAAGESLDGLVPPAVAALIAELGLYRGTEMHNSAE